MTIQEGLAALASEAIDTLFRTAKPMPEDKLSWKPAETSRSAIELVKECSTILIPIAGLLNTGEMGEMNEGKGLKSLAEYEEIACSGIKELVTAIRAFPEERMQETLDLPWGKMSYMDIMAYSYWNTMYHVGQISYIQTMYGNKDMY